MPQLQKTQQLERRARTIVERLNGTWRQGKGMCCCPAHDDRTPCRASWNVSGGWSPSATIATYVSYPQPRRDSTPSAS